MCFLMENYDGKIYLMLEREKIAIKELAEIIKEVVGYKGELKFNPQKPDRTPKLLM